jgi:hypothetical protein
MELERCQDSDYGMHFVETGQNRLPVPAFNVAGLLVVQLMVAIVACA